MVTTLHIRQDAAKGGRYPIRLTLKRDGQPDQTAEAQIKFALSEQDQEDLRWYMEDYLQHADSVEPVVVQQIEAMMKARGEELYQKVLADNLEIQALWFAVRNDLADLRVEITACVTEAASIPWELMRDPRMDSAISLRVKAFVRVQSNAAISFVRPAPAAEDRLRLLYVVCRPNGSRDVSLRAVANRLLQDLGPDRARFDIKALRPPTFEQLQKELHDAKEAGHPYHVVHFDGHGIYADLSGTPFSGSLANLRPFMLGGAKTGKHGYLLFEHPGDEKMRPVDGQTLGQLLRDNGVPMLVLNACQSAMHRATAAPKKTDGTGDEIRTIGSLAQAVVDQGVPAVLGMRYSVYVITAAQYIGQLYAALAKGRSFGQAASEGRKHLQLNPDRWLGLQPRPLQDWFVPVVYEAMPMELLPGQDTGKLDEQPQLDPVQHNRTLLRHVPEQGFIGRDETLLALDRAFDDHRIVLLHAYAGQGKTSTAVEFARWYAVTGGLGPQPIVLFNSFETHTDLDDLLNQASQLFASLLEANGIHWSATNDPEKRRRIVLDILHQFPLLWIWDNVEPVAGFPEGTPSQWTDAEQTDLRDFLHQIQLDTGGRSRVLLTSRREEKGWLGGIPQRILMPPMSGPDAAALALRLGKDKGLARAQIADWKPLLDYCAGNPLTLRVLVGQATREGVHGADVVAAFVEAVRAGEKEIQDADQRQGRDKSLGASLDYGFRNAFKEDELAIIALLHLFPRMVNAQVLHAMSAVGDHALPELKGRSEEAITSLLQRAAETGLLTPIVSRVFFIHPALPWFLGQLFARQYDGRSGRSSAPAALRAWLASVGAFADFWARRFIQGLQDAVIILEVEEANLLQARRLARRNRWWSGVIYCMQGLRVLYDYQGRRVEWARLVEEIRPDYCTAADQPVAGREDDYGLVMDYRVELAWRHEHNLVKAAALQEKRIEWSRQRAALVLAMPPDASLDEAQRSDLRSLASSLANLGQLQFDAGNALCVDTCRQGLTYFRRIGDKVGEAVAELHLGDSYKDIQEIRDLDAAEAAYQRSLALTDAKNRVGRSRCISSIGLVHYERFREAQRRREPGETLHYHLQAAERCLLEALELCPADAVTDRAPTHNALGGLYAEVRQLDNAREHFEKAIQCHEQTGDRHRAGQTRFNMAVMYARASQRESQPARQRDLLVRAQAYAQAALRDFQHYQGRAASDEADVQQLLDGINKELEKLPI